MLSFTVFCVFCSSRRRHTRCALVTGVQTCALPIFKPQVLRQVCEALAPLARAQRPVLVSIAAGITSAQISRWLGGGEGPDAPAIVRCMPNTPAMLGAGVTGLFAKIGRAHV